MFSTSDLSLAAALITLENPLQEIGIFTIPNGQKKGRFFFSDDVRVLEIQYYDSLLVVEPQKFSANLRNLKMRIRDEIME